MHDSYLPAVKRNRRSLYIPPQVGEETESESPSMDDIASADIRGDAGGESTALNSLALGRDARRRDS